MTARRLLVIGLAAGAVVAAALIAAMVFLLTSFLSRGWLIAFAAWSSVPIGSVTLLLIHRLTGGVWGHAIGPVLRPAAALMPLVALAFVPIALTLPAIYPWAANPGATAHDVAQIYLNAPSYLIRAAIALVGWSILGLLLAAGLCSPLLAALGLAFHGVMISLVAVDWFLSIEPRYTATAFASTIAVQQLLAALAFAAVIRPPGLRDRPANDVGGLMIATILGVFYLEGMTFVVAWYGDLPDKAEWYLKRDASGWTWELAALVLIGAVLPFSLLLMRAVRRNPFWLRIVGALVIIGTCLHFVWLLGPGLEAGALILGYAALALCILAFVSVVIGSFLRPRGGAYAG